mmetsp:Transcript_20198/g.30052  ORF Transcript_20198/g.30052 Transcript_20198/m.30052 type:complete len:165 (-) Transcript_20198:331-825(-)
MGKSIRSKIKRKHRAEFRKTIGKDDAEAKMAIVQSKLQECINKGSMNSLDRLSTIMNGPANDSGKEDNEEMNDSMPAIDAVGTTSGAAMDVVTTGKRPEKIPLSKTDTMKMRVTGNVLNLVGQPGGRLARKRLQKAQRRGQLKKGVKVVTRKVRAPRKKKMATF